MVLHPGVKVLNAKVKELISNPQQPRKDIGDIAGLAKSMDKDGLMFPPCAAETGEGLRLHDGHRRVAAAGFLGWDTIPVIVIDSGDPAILGLVANVQRKDLTPLEEATAYKALMDGGMSQRNVAKAVGVTVDRIKRTSRLLHLPEPVQDYINKGKISEGVGIELLRLELLNRLLPECPCHAEPTFSCMCMRIVFTAPRITKREDYRQLVDLMLASIEVCRHTLPADRDAAYGAISAAAKTSPRLLDGHPGAADEVDLWTRDAFIYAGCGAYSPDFRYSALTDADIAAIERAAQRVGVLGTTV